MPNYPPCLITCLRRHLSIILRWPFAAKQITQPSHETRAMDENEELMKKVTALVDLVDAPEPNYEGEVGKEELLDKPDVDIRLFPSRGSPVAGELWSMSGVIHNRSTKPVWIVDAQTVYTLAPEMWGLKSRRGSIGAFFPTIKERKQDEVVRIDPGASYSVIWKISPPGAEDRKKNPFEEDREMNLFEEVSAILRNYMFFRPNNFVTSSTVHVWTTPPKFENGKVTNIGSSYPITTIKEVTLDASPWVIIAGAAIGGLFMFVLQLLFGRIPSPADVSDFLKLIFTGLISAVLLSSISTVLLSRLASFDFVINIKIKDVWGAIASGFVIQWAGYTWLASVLSSIAK